MIIVDNSEYLFIKNADILKPIITLKKHNNCMIEVPITCDKKSNITYNEEPFLEKKQIFIYSISLLYV
jgi:hypothetical protein